MFKEWYQSKSILYKTYLFMHTICSIGIPLILYIWIASWFFSSCPSISVGWSSLQHGELWCAQSNFVVYAIIFGMLFYFAPLFILPLIITLPSMVNNLYVKYILALPCWSFFLYLVGISLLILDTSGILLFLFFIVLVCTIIWIFKMHFHEQKMQKSISSNPYNNYITNNTSISSSLKDKFSKIDISDIEYIHFHENGGQSYKVNLDSIKSIAVYCYQKTGKTSFSAWELSEVRDLLLQNYQSQLSEKDYNMLVTHLYNWVDTGWSLEIVRK